MDFQERFKGRTSTMSKEGPESLIASSGIPVKRDFTPTYSLSHSCIIIEDHTPKSRPNIPLSPASKKNTLTHSSSLVLLPEAATPKGFPYAPPSQLQFSKITPQQPNSPKLPFLSPKNASVQKANGSNSSMVEIFTPKENALRMRNNSLSGIKRNPSLVILRPTHSSIESSPSPTLEPNTNHLPPQGMSLLKHRARSLVRIESELSNQNMNINQLHKKNFEVLSQQNKQRQVTKDAGKDVASPKYSYISDESSPIMWNSKLMDPRQTPLLSPIQHRQEPGSPGKMSRVNNSSFIDEDVARGLFYYVKPESKKGVYNGSQMSFLNKMKNKMTDSMDFSGMQGKNDESTRLYSHGRGGENLSMSLSMMQLSQMLDGSSRMYHKPGSIGNLLIEKNKSEEVHAIKPKRIGAKM